MLFYDGRSGGNVTSVRGRYWPARWKFTPCRLGTRRDSRPAVRATWLWLIPIVERIGIHWVGCHVSVGQCPEKRHERGFLLIVQAEASRSGRQRARRISQRRRKVRVVHDAGVVEFHDFLERC